MDLKYGVVSAWDPAQCKVRVTLPGDNNLQTFWLQVPQGQTLNTKSRSPVEVGTEVAIGLNADGVDGILLGAIYSATSLPPIDDPSSHFIKHCDGAVMKYDPVTHIYDIVLPGGGTLNITSPDGVTITSSAPVTIKADTIIEGNLIVRKSISVEGIGGNSTSNIAGDISINGNVEIKSNLTADSIQSTQPIAAPNI